MLRNENNLMEFTIKGEITNIGMTLQAVGPLVGNALKSGQLFNPQAELTEPDPDILCEYDVKIPMSEGFSVTANIFRSKKAANKNEKVPIVRTFALFILAAARNEKFLAGQIRSSR